MLAAFATLEPSQPLVGLMISPAPHIVSLKKMLRSEKETRNKERT